MDLKNDRMVAVIILIASFAIFRLSPIHGFADSKFSMMFSQQLLWNHSFSLDAAALSLQSSQPVRQYQRGVDFPYHLERWGERFYYWFPPGSTILSMPYVALANGLGLSASDEMGRYDLQADIRIQADLAALLMAGLTAITYLTARFFLPIGWSSLIAGATALGTPVWSTASRTMWVHTWGIFILSGVIWLIARAEMRQRRLHPVLLATCLSWLYFVRPTFAVSIVGVSVYVLIRHRRAFLPLVITGGLWLGLFVSYSYYHFGRPLPIYYESQPNLFKFSTTLWESLAGTLVSPSRGLFIYSPVLVFVGYLLIRYRKTLRPSLTWLALGIVFAHIALMSSYTLWHAGHSYGPRYCTDVIPWFALLGILAIEARLCWATTKANVISIGQLWTEWSFGLLLLGCSVFLHGLAAFSWGPWQWNMHPTNIDFDHPRLWDWKHPPFLELRSRRTDR